MKVMLAAHQLRRGQRQAARTARFLISRRRAGSEVSRVVHILVTKNPLYVAQARACAESILLHMPHAKVTFHVDDGTLPQVRRVMPFLRRWGRHRVELHMIKEQRSSWQMQKFSIILSMMGSMDVLVDADMYWHTQIPCRESPMFFVPEFYLEDQSPFRQFERSFLQSLGGGDGRTLMKNVSVFSWSGFQPGQDDILRILNWDLLFDQTLLAADLGPHDHRTLGRVKEQLLTSIAADYFGWGASFVKSDHEIASRDVVETSFFGVTGVRV